MKNKLINASIMMFCLLFLAACEEENTETDDQITSADVAQIQAAVMNGEWRIAYYFDSEKEETQDYFGYVFSFNQDSSLVASNGSLSISGAWSISDSADNSDDSNDMGDIDFNIFFGTPDDFEELSDDWDILEYSDTILRLTDVSGGNGGTDFLTLEKL